jgi:hypothetical protein
MSAAWNPTGTGIETTIKIEIKIGTGRRAKPKSQRKNAARLRKK